MQAGTLSRIYKRAECNKAVQAGFFSNIKSKKSLENGEVSKTKKFSKRIIICAARLLDTLEWLHNTFVLWCRIMRKNFSFSCKNEFFV